MLPTDKECDDIVKEIRNGSLKNRNNNENSFFVNFFAFILLLFVAIFVVSTMLDILKLVLSILYG